MKSEKIGTMRTLTILLILINLWSCKETRRNSDYSESPFASNIQVETSTPEQNGMDSDALNKLINFVKQENLNLNSIVIARNGKTVLDAHFYPNRKEYLHDIASVTKSIASILIGIAIDEGLIQNENQKIIDFFPEYKHFFDTDEKKTITIKNILTMSSGLCSSFGQGEQQRNEMKMVENPVEFLMKNQLASKTGDAFIYCSPSVQLLSIILSKVTDCSMEQYAKKKLFQPLGITDFKFGTDINGYTNASGDCFLLANDLLKLGQLFLDNGTYNNKQIVSKEWVKKSSTKWMNFDNGESYGFLWWLRDDLDGLIEAQGRGGQRLIIVPKERLVVVMLGTGFEPGDIGKFIVESIKSDKPIAENKSAYSRLYNGLMSIQEEYNTLETKQIPYLAKEIDSKRFTFEHNDMGLTYFLLNAFERDSGFLTMSLNLQETEEYGVRKVPIGLNGKYKISHQGRFNTFMAARATWINEKTIKIDYNEFSNAHKYQIEIIFNNNKAIWTMWDEADYGEPFSLNAYSK